MATGDMTDAEIRAALKARGFGDIPVVASTRATCLSLLQKPKKAAGSRQARTSYTAASTGSRAGVAAGLSRTEVRPPARSNGSLRTVSGVAAGLSRTEVRPPARSNGSLRTVSDHYDTMVVDDDLPSSSCTSGNSASHGHALATTFNCSDMDDAASAVSEDAASAVSEDPDDQVVRLQAKLAECQQRLETAEAQCARYQEQHAASLLPGAAATATSAVVCDEHVQVLRSNFHMALDQPSRIIDTCFLAGHGRKVLANRAICATRCEGMVELLWRQDEYPVTVVSVENRTLAVVRVCLDYSVRSLKELVFATTGISVARQRLVFSSSELTNRSRLSDYGMVRECTVQLVESALAGKSSANGEVADPQYPIQCVIDMSDIDAGSLHSFLLYLYTATVDVSTDNVCGVFILAQRFKISLLRRECLGFLRDHMDLDNVWELLRISHVHCCDDLKILCLMFVSRRGALAQQLEGSIPELCSDLMQFWKLRQQ